jgi:UPF0755 protein
MPSAVILRRIALGVVLALWLGGTALLTWAMIVVPNRPLAKAGKDTPVELPANATPEQVAALLTQNGVIDQPRMFAFYLRVTDVQPRLRTGWVVINRALSMREHLARIATGFGDSSVDVLIPEGFTQFDVAARLERFGVVARDEFLSAARDPRLLAQLGIEADSAEGYLFPALYRLRQSNTPGKVLERMVETFKARTDPVVAARRQEGLPLTPLTPQQVLTLASIVEREARMPDERPRIAGVFYNRLFDPSFKPKRLQADPTAAYGCLLLGADKIESCREFDGRHVTPAMVRDASNPYNTYRIEGLPPGPICNPGLASISAALSPERHNYFYFVVKGEGRHAFSESLGAHNQSVHPVETPSTPQP